MSFLQSVRNKSSEKSILHKITLFIFTLGVMAVPLFFLPFTQDFLNVPKVYLATGLVLLVACLYLLDMVLSKQAILRRTVLDIPLVILLLVWGVATFFSVIPGISLLGIMDLYVMNLVSLVVFLLWFWLLIQLVRTSKEWHVILNSFLVAGSIAGVLFIFQKISVFNFVLQNNIFNTISSSNSVFGVFMAIIAIIGLGLVQIKNRDWLKQIVPFISSVVAIITLLRLGFTNPLIVFAVGLGLLLVIGTTMISSTRTWVTSTVFGLFIGTILMIFLSAPSFLSFDLSPEYSLNFSTSWDISSQTIMKDVQSFLLGSGPGTFAQDFSKFRPESLNMNSQAWTQRFYTPYNTPLAILAETGFLGLITFLVIIFIAIGGLFSAWLKARPSVWKRVKEEVKNKVSDNISLDAMRIEVFVVMTAWISLTVGMFITFFNATMWWSWWLLLAMSIVGLSALLPSFVREKQFSLEVSPQYSLILSFGMIVVITLMILVGTFSTRLLLADINFYEAVNAKNLKQKERHLNESLELRSSYVPYRIAKSRIQLRKASLAAQKGGNKTQIAQHVANAVNITKKATDDVPNSIETWETLASMYINAQTLVPEANQWAEKTLKKAIELEPTNPTFHWRLGNVYAYSGKNKKAEESLRKAIKLKPNYVIAYIHLSQVLASQKKYSEAISLYQPILPIVRDAPQALFNLGRLYYNRGQEGDLNKAEQAWKRSVNLSPDYANALYALGLLYEKQGNTAKAQKYYDKVKSLTPDNTNIDQKRGVVEDIENQNQQTNQ